MGVVDGYPDVRDTWTNLKVEVNSMEVEGEQHQVRGSVLVRTPRSPPSIVVATGCKSLAGW